MWAPSYRAYTPSDVIFSIVLELTSSSSSSSLFGTALSVTVSLSASSARASSLTSLCRRIGLSNCPQPAHRQSAGGLCALSHRVHLAPQVRKRGAFHAFVGHAFGALRPLRWLPFANYIHHADIPLRQCVISAVGFALNRLFGYVRYLLGLIHAPVSFLLSRWKASLVYLCRVSFVYFSSSLRLQHTFVDISTLAKCPIAYG